MAISQAISILLCSVLLVSGDELTPFIAWSTEQSLSELDPRSTSDDVISVLGTSEASTIVVFAFDKLSFDDIVAYGSDDNSVSNIESYMESAPFKYWNGLNPMSTQWVSDFAEKLGAIPNYVPENQVNEIEPINSVYIFRLSSFNSFETNDAIIGRVMKSVKESSGDSYLVICTAISKTAQSSHRFLRAAPALQADPDQATDSPNVLNPDCPIGGQLNYTGDDSNKTSNPCILFCLSSPITFTPSTNNTNGTCTLNMPYLITYNCPLSGNSSMDDDSLITDYYGRPYPSVTLFYKVLNISNDTALNNCTADVWDNFSEKPEMPHFESSVPELDVNLTFFFPHNFTYNRTHVDKNWAVMISSVYTQRWATSDEDRPGVSKPDDKDDGGETVSERFLLVRKTPSGLYQNFMIPEGNSYACSAPVQSMYTTADYSVENSTLNVLGYMYIVNSSDSSQLTLASLQVQAYNVSNTTDDKPAEFSSADNCVGYFTEASWMGIVSMSILIIIFYLAILCTFSLKTLDQFEDPRGETISVEKLH